MTAKMHSSIEKRSFQSFPGALFVSRREQLLSVRGLGDAVYLCSFPPHQEYLAAVSCVSASSFTPPDHPGFGQCSREGRSCPAVPWQARGTERGCEMQVPLFSSFSLASKHSLIIVRSEQLAHFYTYPAPCL